MKKLILPLMLLLFVGALLAVESDPSAVVGYVKYDCVSGLNFIAVPMDQGYTMASELAEDYPGMLDTMNYWDPTTQVWSAASDLGGFWDNDFAVVPGAVLWISAMNTFSLYSIGQLPATNASYPIIAGLNTVMIPLNRSDLTMASEFGTDIGTTDTINTWDAATQVWSAASDLGGFWDNDFPISIGSPLWVSAFGAGTWPTRSASPTLMLKNN